MYDDEDDDDRGRDDDIKTAATIIRTWEKTIAPE